MRYDYYIDWSKKLVNCIKCNCFITLLPPVDGYCWACWVGHPLKEKHNENNKKRTHAGNMSLFGEERNVPSSKSRMRDRA